MKSKTTKTIEEIRASLMEVFPIVCDKPECRRSYAIEDFAHVLTLWGYIFLTNGEESFLGFTCPDCWHTTLKKYPFGSPTSVTVISEWKNGRVHYRYPDNTLTGSFVHFSAKTLSDLSLISPDRIQPVTGKGKPFGIPGGFSPISSFPAIFSAEFPYAIPEESIPVLLEIENDPDCGYKAFPRIFASHSVYERTDEILTLLEPLRRDSFAWSDDLLHQQELMGEDYSFYLGQSITEILEREVQMSRNKQNDSKYTHMIADDLSPEELADMDFSINRVFGKDFRKDVQELFEEYRILRNRKDFDVTYTIQFINKYARRFFHEEGYLQALENKMCAHAQTMVDLEDWEEPAVGEQSQINEPQKSPVPPKAKEAENLDSLVRAIEEDQPSLKDKQNVFMCMQDVWYIKFKGKRTVLKNLKGLQIIATLIQSPYKSLSNVGLASKNPKNALESINPRMEADVNLPYEVRANVESEVNRLLEDKQKRISLNKDESIEDIDRSIGLIRDNLAKVYGAELLILETEEGQKASIKARKTKLPKELEDARKNVGSLLTSSYDSILKPMPDLESYLRQCISTKSRFAIYEPHKSQTDKSIKWDVSW